MNINTAYYGLLTTDRQKRRFRCIQKVTGWCYRNITWGWWYNRINHFVIIPIGKMYIR